MRTVPRRSISVRILSAACAVRSPVGNAAMTSTSAKPHRKSRRMTRSFLACGAAMSRGSSALSGSPADYRRRITVDNGTEFTSKALEHWATGTESNSTLVGRGSPSTRRSSKCPARFDVSVSVALVSQTRRSAAHAPDVARRLQRRQCLGPSPDRISPAEWTRFWEERPTAKNWSLQRGSLVAYVTNVRNSSVASLPTPLMIKAMSASHEGGRRHEAYRRNGRGRRSRGHGKCIERADPLGWPAQRRVGGGREERRSRGTRAERVVGPGPAAGEGDDPARERRWPGDGHLPSHGA